MEIIMTNQRNHRIILLEQTLADDFVPHLPPLLDQSLSPEDQSRKNLSRAFGAFVLKKLCSIAPETASQAVIDDFNDYGVDAIYYHAPKETLYLVQSKLKPSKQFKQDEALEFCQGIRKLIKQDFNGFNQNVQNRITEIEDAFNQCSHIQLVVAHVGSGISNHAKQALEELCADPDHGEERLAQTIDYDANRLTQDLQAGNAYERVDISIRLIQPCSVSESRTTYFGLVKLLDLVKLHQQHGEALYAKNIRTFLGHKTEVNVSIQQTLAENLKDFLFFNNGVTVLCEVIQPKGVQTIEGRSEKKFEILGFSVINGAQTIASSARFLEDNQDADISQARVLLTLIQSSADDDFGKSVTYARNHQNPMSRSSFLALDDEQERLRRELAYLKIHYEYKAAAIDAVSDPSRIRAEEAALALALFQPDPRYVVWLREPGRLLDINSEQYKQLFSPQLTVQMLINAVRLNRYVSQRIMQESGGASGQERLAYKHGNYALGWILAKRVKKEAEGVKLFDNEKLQSTLSVPFDQLRQTHWNKTQSFTGYSQGPPATFTKGSLALFRNQTDVISFLETVLIENFGLLEDSIIAQKRSQQGDGQPYPKNLFDYIISKAPQISGLT
ncbi:MAG: AIPR family protein [Phormidesmis sp. CAN_BIN44]|nr:AIPR family protein [Phormidesmis sp. CAN_BIN44]